MARGRRVATNITGVLSLVVALGACGGGTGDSTSAPSAPVSPSASIPVTDLPGRLMFSRFDEGTHTFISTHIARPDGSNETELPLPGPEGGGRWSRSGEEIAVMTVLPDERIGTAVITPDGTVDRVLEIPDESLNLVCVVWSPDDSRLACEGFDEKHPSRAGIYTVRSSDGGDLQRLTTTPEGMVDSLGDYSPDGDQFVFKRSADEANGPLMIVDITGGKPRSLSTSEFEDPGRFSPDGESVLTSAGGIVIVDLDGDVVQRVGEPGANLFGPVWSPDGKWIAFSRGTTGPFADIFISRPDGTDRRQITSTAANEIVVEWGADEG
jgi:Tol biopolymer transport system component